jgi:hypothetical protein
MAIKFHQRLRPPERVIVLFSKSLYQKFVNTFVTWSAFGSRLNAHSADSSMRVLVRQLGCDVFATIDKKWVRVAGMSALPLKGDIDRYPLYHQKIPT